MPERLLYDGVPGWDDFRAPARFMIMTFLGLAMLASFTIHNLMKDYFTGDKKKYIVVVAIGIVILFEYSFIPYPSYSEQISDVYEIIKNDTTVRAILESPMGGTGDFLLMTDPTILYYQTVHEKPIYSGHESRPSLDVLRETQTYFLNMFQLEGSKNDVIKQDIGIHGLSILNYYEIDYVMIHKSLSSKGWNEIEGQKIQKYIDTVFYPETKELMHKILDSNESFFEDEKLVSFKIPNNNSKNPFLLLGDGWYLFNSQSRVTFPNFEIIIINPSDDHITTTLSLEISSFGDAKNAKIIINEEFVTETLIENQFQNILLNDIKLKPGQNLIVFDTDQYEIWIEPTFNIEYQASFVVKSIILEN